MKRALAACVLVAVAGCALFTQANLERMRAAELAACFIAHATLPDSKAIAVACNVGPEFTDMIARIVGEHNSGMLRELHNAGKCRPSTARITPPLREYPNGDKDRFVELW